MNQQRGSVLLGSVMLLTVLSMILIGVDTQNQGGSGLMQVVNSEHTWVQRDYANVTALNLAEAGLEKALDDMSTNWASGNGYSRSETFAIGQYSVQTVGSTSSSYTLEAAGSAFFNDSVVTRKVHLTLTKEGVEDPYTILTNGNLNFKKASVTINGASDVVFHTNGNFHYDGAVAVYTEDESGQTIYGDITASGNIDGNGTLASGTATANSPNVTLPTINFDQLKTDSVTQIDGNYSVNGGSLGSSGVITYIDGNLTFDGSVTARGTIVVDGNLDITGSVKPPSGETLEIITKGNVDFDDQGNSSAGPELVASVYCEGNFKLRPGSPWIEGFVVATGNMEFTSANAGSLRMDYQENPDSKLTTFKTSIADWQEVY